MDKKYIIIDNNKDDMSFVDYAIALIGLYEKGYDIEVNLINEQDTEPSYNRYILNYWKDDCKNENVYKRFCNIKLTISIFDKELNETVVIMITDENEYSFNLKIGFVTNFIYFEIPICQKISNEEYTRLYNLNKSKNRSLSFLSKEKNRPLAKTLKYYISYLHTIKELYKTGFFNNYYVNVFKEFDDSSLLIIKKISPKLIAYKNILEKKELFDLNYDENYEKISLLVDSLIKIKNIYYNYWDQKYHSNDSKLVEIFKSGIDFEDLNFYVPKDKFLMVKFCKLEVLHFSNIQILKYVETYQLAFILNYLLMTNNFEKFLNMVDIMKFKADIMLRAGD